MASLRIAGLLLFILPLLVSNICCYDYAYVNTEMQEEDKCSESPDNNAYRCMRWNSCINCKHLETITNCRCDDMCHYYGDCCPDTHNDTFSERLESETFQCVQRLTNNAFTHISVIMACPKSSDVESKRKCQENGELHQ